MLLVGLTGGVGSGKSTVATALQNHGAVVIDADVIAREVVEPGTIAFDAIKARFGRSVIGTDGRIDRQMLGDIVFADDDALADLNGIVHPFVRDEIQQRLARERDTEDIVVLVIPLLLESGHYKVDAIVVVDAAEDQAVERLVAQRGWTERHARRRIAAQLTREERRAAADFVVDNGGSIENLRSQIDKLWLWLRQRAENA